MAESELKLPASVKHVSLDGREIYLVGTAHVSKQSVEDVKTTIEAVQPDTVAVELCEPRYNAMTQQQDWKKSNIFKIIREKKSVLLLAQLIMTAFYRRLGEKLGVKPGAEMLEAINQAKKMDANLVLADRDVQITLKRVWGYLGFWNKLKLMAELLASLLFTEKIDAELVEQMKQQDQLESIMAEFAKKFPEIKNRLIDERDVYLAQKIRKAEGSKIVVVVGAGHVPGIETQIHKDVPLAPLEEVPPKSIAPLIIKWAIPVAIIVLLVAGFFMGKTESSIQNIYIWVFVNGILAALGSAIALAHPVTIVVSFFAAPLTSLNPLVAAGWVAGIVQAWVRKPTVSDFNNLPEATASVKAFWTNPVTKILLVVVLANLGSTIGTFIAGPWIAARFF